MNISIFIINPIISYLCTKIPQQKIEYLHGESEKPSVFQLTIKIAKIIQNKFLIDQNESKNVSI